jgi:hypothetical protein
MIQRNYALHRQNLERAKRGDNRTQAPRRSTPISWLRAILKKLLG